MLPAKIKEVQRWKSFWANDCFSPSSGKFHLDRAWFFGLGNRSIAREAEESNTSILKHWRIILYRFSSYLYFNAWFGLSGSFFPSLLCVLWRPVALPQELGWGPTDLVAFASCQNGFSFPKRVENILQGEGLLNDASGLLLSARWLCLTTGSFSLES